MSTVSIRSAFLFFILNISSFLIGCGSSNKVSVKPNEHMEVGWTPRSVFQSPVYAAWFDTGYANYIPSVDKINQLKRMKDSVEFFVVYGTWCGDSKREMPRFFKIMDDVQFPSDKITLIAIDRTKQIPAGIAVENNITNVPTFLIKYRGMELGRIIESPKTSLENDIFEYLSPAFP
ncbi:MAG: thioredoxin family protein [Ignavibacteriales bacterium]|nr:thioredoxin family protein [Ignavibacteriales bacterium]